MLKNKNERRDKYVYTDSHVYPYSYDYMYSFPNPYIYNCPDIARRLNHDYIARISGFYRWLTLSDNLTFTYIINPTDEYIAVMTSIIYVFKKLISLPKFKKAKGFQELMGDINRCWPIKPAK
jgi:hypothetical protein